MHHFCFFNLHVNLDSRRPKYMRWEVKLCNYCPIIGHQVAQATVSHSPIIALHIIISPNTPLHNKFIQPYFYLEAQSLPPPRLFLYHSWSTCAGLKSLWHKTLNEPPGWTANDKTRTPMRASFISLINSQQPKVSCDSWARRQTIDGITGWLKKHYH